MEQALLDLLKNAHETAGGPEHVALNPRRAGNGWGVDVLDRGNGELCVTLFLPD